MAKMAKRNWDKVAKNEFEAMDADEQQSFRDLRDRLYGG